MRKLAVYLLAGALPWAARAEDKLTPRTIIRAGVDAKGKAHGEFAKITKIKNLTAVSYKLLVLDESGKERFVDEKEHVFKVGQQFRLLIEAETDVYIYVFHEGPDGVRTVL